MARVYTLKKHFADIVLQTTESDLSTTISETKDKVDFSLQCNERPETAMSAMSRQECFDINSLQSIITEFRHHPERFLSVQNLQLILDGLGEPTDSKTIEEWIKFYDQNDKGGIELVGFLQMVLDQILPIEDTEEEIEDAFKVFDPEETGIINSDALEHILKTQGNHFSTEEFALFMDTVNPKKEKNFKWKEFSQKFVEEVYPPSTGNAIW